MLYLCKKIQACFHYNLNSGHKFYIKFGNVTVHVVMIT